MKGQLLDLLPCFLIIANDRVDLFHTDRAAIVRQCFEIEPVLFRREKRCRENKFFCFNLFWQICKPAITDFKFYLRLLRVRCFVKYVNTHREKTFHTINRITIQLVTIKPINRILNNQNYYIKYNLFSDHLLIHDKSLNYIKKCNFFKIINLK